MIIIKDAEAIEKMRAANAIVALLLQELGKMIVPGISTYELDKFAEDLILAHEAKPGFKGYTVPGLAPFPGSLCTSLNSCIVHGIPSRDDILKEGDIIGIDVGVCKNGYFGDGAKTYAVGDVSEQARDLMNVTRNALNIGIMMAVEGNRVGDIGYAIHSYVREHGYYVADDLTGHGIGQSLHEEPMVPNVGIKGRGPRLKKGMTIAIEPMVNIGTNRVRDYGWPVKVKDGSLSAHYEHTILITETTPEILTKVN